MKTALGVDIGATKIAGALVSADGSIGQIKQVATAAGNDQNLLIEQIINFTKQFNLLDIDAIGVSVAAVVENNIVIRSTNLPINNSALAECIKQSVDKPVVVVNDADAALLGETWQGAAKGKKNAIMLTLGSGIGGALSGKPNAELGHIVVDPGSVLTCGGGHRGDIEALIGGRATRQRLGKPMPELIRDITYQNFFVKWLEKSIIILINQFNPDIIILGGGISASAPLFFNKLAPFKTTVALAKLGVNAGIFGAGLAAMKGGL